jgi:hypothetical protein
MRWWGFVAAAALATLPARGLRAEPARAPRVEASPAQLRVAAGATRDTLRLTLANVSDQAIVVYLDQRLAQVELRGERRSLGACRLPGDAVPRAPDDRRFVSLEPGQETSEELDLRFQCYAAAKLQALATARAVGVTYQARFATDRLGRTSFTGRLGPVEVVLGPAAAAQPAAVAAQPAAVAAQPAAVAAQPAAAAAQPAAAAAQPFVTLHRVGPRPDVGLGDALSVTVEVRGPARGRLPVAVRSEAFTFEVDGPGAAPPAVCQLPATRVRPLAEFYDRLGRRRLGFDLADLCPSRTFARPGVYSVRPAFRSALDGADVGLSAWTGEALGEPFLARVRRAGREADDPVEIAVPAVAAPRGAEDAR